jgi:hypothetical protein
MTRARKRKGLGIFSLLLLILGMGGLRGVRGRCEWYALSVCPVKRVSPLSR